MLWTMMAALALAAQHPETGRTFALVEEFRIGSIDQPNYSLTEVGDLAIGHKGQIFVTQPRERVVRVYDHAGRFLRLVGREGAGPGEFYSIGRIGWKQDTLWVSDPSQFRVSFFTPEGEVVRTTYVQSPANEGMRPAGPAAVLADGTFVGDPGTSPRRIASGSITTEPLLRLNRDGRVLGKLADLDLRGKLAVATYRRMVMVFGLPLQHHTIWDVRPDGSAIVVVHRHQPTSDRIGRFRILLAEATGDTVFSESYSYVPRPVPRAEAESLREPLVGFFRRARMSRGLAMEMAQDSVPIPYYYPPVLDVVAARDGTIWLRLPSRSKSAEWLILDGRGSIIGTLEAPTDLQIMQAQMDRVWGITTDDFDVPYIVGYRVQDGTDERF